MEGHWVADKGQLTDERVDEQLWVTELLNIAKDRTLGNLY
jgi:hypothetical protein